MQQKEQLPEKKFNVLALYLEADQLMNDLKAVIMELRDGAQLAVQEVVKSREEKESEKPKKKE